MPNNIIPLKGRSGKRSDDSGEKAPPQAVRLVALAEDAEFFHTADGKPFAVIQVDGHSEVWPLRVKGFRQWLARRFYTAEGKPPAAQAMQDAFAVLEARAIFDGPERPVFLRTAQTGDSIFLDLADEHWRAIEIDAVGWRLVSRHPVKFRRARGMLPLPCPESGGRIEALRDFVNIPDENAWRLLVAWLVAALRPAGPYPILVLVGEQGSAKSTTARVLKSLVDPNSAALRTTPRDERDLIIAANNQWAPVLDNLSGIPPWLSDAICRLSTGGGFATRELYTDSEEVLFDAMRPVMVNGIDEVTSRHDFLDRALILNLPSIPEERRRPERDFWTDFETARPAILGGLLDAVAAGLRNINHTRLDRLPRMADFATWIAAAEEALPWPAGGFMEAYAGNRAEAVELALEADAVSVAVRSLLAEHGTWTGTASELLAALEPHAPEAAKKAKAWPGSPKAIASRVRRAATFLRQVGIEAEFIRAADTGRARLIRLGRESIVQTVQTVQNIGLPEISGWTNPGRILDGMDGSSKESSKDKPASNKTLDGVDVLDAKNPSSSKDMEEGFI